jgi:hypothetical protein
MGFLTKLLTLPASGPLNGVLWVAEKLTEAAETKFYDPESIKRELAMHEARLVAGEITEDEYEAVEMELLLRLKESVKKGL